MKQLESLGFNEKEIRIYLYLIEYGSSPASEISRSIHIPKSTVNFIADNLWERWILKKSFQWNTGYFEADVTMLEEVVEHESQQKMQALSAAIPLLKEKNKQVMSRPKMIFFDGRDMCRKAYSDILIMKEKIFYEFWAHQDLEEWLGVNFMNEFIWKRVKKQIFCKAIGTQYEIMNNLQKDDEKHLRDLNIINTTSWDITSSIAIYDDKVLILNLKGAQNGVCIENKDFAETMKTIFRICDW